MAITKSIVELMGGTIKVSSEVNRGSLFQVDLELRVQEAQADRQFWEKRGISCVLLVDGDPESRENILALTEDTGIRLEAVSGAEEAAAWMGGGGDCQLALLDWESCGLPAALALRELLPENVPVVLLAELDGEGVEEALGRLGPAAVLTKPFFVSAFREKASELWAEPGEVLLPEAGAPADLRGLRFLAAEDNAINAEILAELLEIEGASCEIVENGRLALERFQRAAEGEFDAILMDVQMPVMNGHEASRAIRALDREDAASIPIIAMTANAFAEDERAALDAGMSAHVAKPLDMELLRRVIRQCTTKERS